MDLNTEIKKGNIIVLTIPNQLYTTKITDVAKYFANNYNAICYISLNKILDSLTTNLKNANVNPNKFLFIDGITKSANPNVKECKNCIYLASSSALTALSIAINKALATGKFDGLLFDSLSTLLIYNKPESVSKFVHSLVNKIKNANITAVFTALEGDTKSTLLKEIGMYVDKVIKYE